MEKIESAYVLNGTEHEDLNSPESPFQGRTLAKYMKVNGEWSFVMRDGNGKPNLGYLAQEISETEASKWRNRIQQANSSGSSGYLDSEGHWFSGEAIGSVITLAAWNKLQVFKMNSYYSHGAVKEIDILADKIMAENHPRGPEYEARYMEATVYLANPSDDADKFPYLSQLRFKGLDLAAAAKLVVEKYELAKANDVKIAEARMKKSLLKSPIPLAEKKELYEAIVASLRAAKI